MIPNSDPEEDIPLQLLRPNLAEIRARHQALQEQGDADRLLAEIHAVEAGATNNLALPTPSDLLSFPHGQEIQQMPERMPAFYSGMEPRLIPLAKRFPMVPNEYLRQPADNKFLPENIIRLNNDRTQSAKQQEVKYMNVSEDQLQVGTEKG